MKDPMMLFREQTVQSLRDRREKGQGTRSVAPGKSTGKSVGGRVPITVGESRYLRADRFQGARPWL